MADPAQIARGKQVCAERRCAACHAVAGEGNRKSPLDGVGARVDAKDLRRWIVTPREMKPTVKRPLYDEMPAADIDALVAYLERLS